MVPFLWGIFLVWFLVAGLFHPWTGLLFLLAGISIHSYYAPPSGLMLILLMTGIVLALGLLLVSWRIAPKDVPSPTWALGASLAALLVGGVLLGPRLGLGLAGLVGSKVLRYLTRGGRPEWYWRILAAWLFPRLGLLILWFLFLGQVLGSFYS